MHADDLAPYRPTRQAVATPDRQLRRRQVDRELLSRPGDGVTEHSWRSGENQGASGYLASHAECGNVVRVQFRDGRDGEADDRAGDRTDLVGAGGLCGRVRESLDGPTRGEPAP
ncbi:hypothetical protein EEB19_09685 [Gordonia sp. OPL2]|nr:hypothetical protein EEB19_09685 [Gordonia sp. OPL2]